MQNFVQPGNTIELTAPYTVTAGQGCLKGTIFGVACGDVTSGAVGQFMLEGVFDLTKDNSVFATVGLLVEWNNTSRKCQLSTSAGVIIGACIATATAGGSTVRVRLNGAFGV